MRPSDLTVFVACGDPRLRGRMVAALAADAISLSASPLAPANVAVLAFDLSASNRITELRAAVRGLPAKDVTIVSPNSGPLGARRATREGVAGIVLEADLEAALAPAVRAVAAGLTAIPVALRSEADKMSLTRRELQVLHLVAAGRTNQEIALALFLAESTVKSHLTSLFRKVGAESRNELARLARDPGGGLLHLFRPPSASIPCSGDGTPKTGDKSPPKFVQDPAICAKTGVGSLVRGPTSRV
jgi:DNA-binding NarL/FixJ family response regulator